MATYRWYSVDNVDDVKQYGDFDAYFKCKDIDISDDEIENSEFDFDV